MEWELSSRRSYSISSPFANWGYRPRSGGIVILHNSRTKLILYHIIIHPAWPRLDPHPTKLLPDGTPVQALASISGHSVNLTRVHVPLRPPSLIFTDSRKSKQKDKKKEISCSSGQLSIVTSKSDPQIFQPLGAFPILESGVRLNSTISIALPALVFTPLYSAKKKKERIGITEDTKLVTSFHTLSI